MLRQVDGAWISPVRGLAFCICPRKTIPISLQKVDINFLFCRVHIFAYEYWKRLILSAHVCFQQFSKVAWPPWNWVGVVLWSSVRSASWLHITKEFGRAFIFARSLGFFFVDDRYHGVVCGFWDPLYFWVQDYRWLKPFLARCQYHLEQVLPFWFAGFRPTIIMKHWPDFGDSPDSFFVSSSLRQHDCPCHSYMEDDGFWSPFYTCHSKRW